MSKYSRFTNINKKRWNELVKHHISNSSYDIDSFMDGNSTLNEIEKNLMGDISGKRILHLQCHFGLDTMSLLYEGAKEVVGIDFSPKAIQQANKLKKRLDLNARFILSDIMNLPENYEAYNTFDWVFTTYGTIGWLPNLEKWGEVIAKYLRTNGRFIIVDSHPFSHIFDDETNKPELIPIMDYFGSSDPQHYIVEGSYATSAQLDNKDEYLWTHPLKDIFGVLLKNDLQILSFDEYDRINWKMFPFLEKQEDGWYYFPSDFKIKIPLLFSLVAKKVK